MIGDRRSSCFFVGIMISVPLPPTDFSALLSWYHSRFLAFGEQDGIIATAQSVGGSKVKLPHYHHDTRDSFRPTGVRVK